MLVALGPAGCGFRPLYGKADSVDSAEAVELAGVRVLGIEDRNGQQLRNSLVRRLSPRGEPSRPRYSLQVKVTETLEGLAESIDGKATVGRLSAIATFTLHDYKTGAVVTDGSARTLASMRYLGPRYASVATERGTEEVVLNDLADQIHTSLATWFANRRAGVSTAPAQP